MMRELRDWINAGLELRLLKPCAFRGLAYLQQRNVLTSRWTDMKDIFTAEG